MDWKDLPKYYEDCARKFDLELIKLHRSYLCHTNSDGDARGSNSIDYSFVDTSNGFKFSTAVEKEIPLLEKYKELLGDLRNFKKADALEKANGLKRTAYEQEKILRQKKRSLTIRKDSKGIQLIDPKLTKIVRLNDELALLIRLIELQ
jgi:hypothetical protein